MLDFSDVIDIEYSALKMLIEGEEKVSQHGVVLWRAGLNPEVLHMVQRSTLGQTLGRERMIFDLEIAVERFRAQAATLDGR